MYFPNFTREYLDSPLHAPSRRAPGPRGLSDDPERSHISKRGQRAVSLFVLLIRVRPRHLAPHTLITLLTALEVRFCTSAAISCLLQLTSRLDRRCHLHFTLTRRFPPILPNPPVPQVIYHPVWTTPPPPLSLSLSPPSCSKSMISN